jgi:hypothetical protein
MGLDHPSLLSPQAQARTEDRTSQLIDLATQSFGGGLDLFVEIRSLPVWHVA